MPSFPIPDGPHNDPWKSLLPLCLAVIDEVVRERGVAFPFQIGGGSMLLRRYGHRKSRDLDLFVTDASLVRWCSPRFNDAASDLFADYGEEAAAVKLITGMQEIDIIAAAPVIMKDAVENAAIGERDILVERPREILAKKIAYRGRNFQPRDVFDLACVAYAEPEELAAILPWLTLTHLDNLEVRLKEIEPILEKELADKVDPYPRYAPIVDECLEIASGVVQAWKKALTPKVEVPSYCKDTHRAVFSRDGLTVVVKEWNSLTERFDLIGNDLGPAMVGPDGVSFFLGGKEITQEEWANAVQTPDAPEPDPSSRF
jgi:hypothetical protein